MAVPGSPLHQKPTLGLDLQGGLEVTLQAEPPVDRELTEEDLNRSVDIMRNRVDKLGVTEPEIRTQGDDQIVIQLPGVSDPEAAAEIIGTTAQLELYDLETSLTGPSVSVRGFPIEHTSLYELLARVQSQVEEGVGRLLRREPEHEARRPRAVRVRGGGAEEDEGEAAAGSGAVRVPQDMVVVTCGSSDPDANVAEVCPGGQTEAASRPTARTTTSSRTTPRTSRR